MPNGKPGDNPLTDLLKHGTRVFPDDICDAIIEIVAIDPLAFQTDYHIGKVDWAALDAHVGDWIGWSREHRYEEARSFLRAKRLLAKSIVDQRDPLADKVSASIQAAFPEWTSHAMRAAFTSDTGTWPEEGFAATRTHWDYFVYGLPSETELRTLVVETFPKPRVLENITPLAEFAPGDDASVVNLLKSLVN